jgi:YVTN family beta-propeller protein
MPPAGARLRSIWIGATSEGPNAREGGPGEEGPRRSMIGRRQIRGSAVIALSTVMLLLTAGVAVTRGAAAGPSRSLVTGGIDRTLVGPTLSISPADGPVTTTVNATGSGYPPDTWISFVFDGLVVSSTCSTDSTGNFPGSTGSPCSFRVPASPAGNETVSAMALTGPTTLGVGVAPGPVLDDPGAGEVFVANDGSSNVSVLSTSADAVVATVPVGENPVALVYDPAKGEVFVANSGSNNVSVISDQTNALVATVATGTYPDALVYDSRQGEVFVGNGVSETVSVINDTTNTVVATTTGEEDPFSLAYDPAKGEVFVANVGSSNVTVINDTTNLRVATIEVGEEPSPLIYDPATGDIFVDNYASGNVSVISDATDTLVTTIPVGSLPVDLAYDPAKQEVFVLNADSQNVSVISDQSDSVIASTSVGSYPTWIAYGAGSGDLFVVDGSGASVSVLNDTSDAVVSVFGVGSNPDSTVYDSASDSIFTANYVSQSVSVDPIAGLTGLTSFVVEPSLAMSPSSDLADLGQTVTVEGTGFGGSLSMRSSMLSTTPIACTSATLGTCNDGVVSANRSGSFTAQFVVPASTSVGLDELVLTDTAGNTASTALTVYADPTMSLPTGAPGSGLVDGGGSVTFSATAASGTGVYPSFNWTGLPAGCLGSQATVTCAGADLPAGAYNISAAVTDSSGFTSSPSPTLAYRVDLGPTVSPLSTSRESADVGQTVTFSATSGSGSGGDVYTWHGLPEGCLGSDTSSTTCTPTESGYLNVSLTITDSDSGSASSGSISFHVYADPTLNLSSNRYDFDVGQMLRLTAGGTPGSGGDVYSWSGLPATCAGGTATLVCATGVNGTFSIDVEVTDSNGASARSAVIVLHVAPRLLTSFTASPASPSTGQPVEFSPSVVGGTGPDNYTWEFGDGAVASGLAAQHSYDTAGEYNVSFWVNDSTGASAQYSITVWVSSSVGNSVTTIELSAIGGVVVLLVCVAVGVLRYRRRKSTSASATDPPTEAGPDELE